MRSLFKSVAAVAGLLGAGAPWTAGRAGEPGLPAGADHTLRLAEFAFDPLGQEPVLPAGWDRSLVAEPDLHLVQFEGPIPGDAIARLQQAGLAPVRYVYPNTYVVWGRSADRDRLRGQARVRWAGDFAPAYRTLPSLRDRSGGVLDVRVLIYRGAGAGGVAAALSVLGVPLGARTVIDDTLEIAGFQLPASALRLAAAIPGVYSIQPWDGDWQARAELSDQINVDEIDPETNVPVPGYRNWLEAAAVDGTGVTVAIVDEGVYQAHPDLAAGHLPCTGASCTDAPSLHGSHVAGVITGDGASKTVDANGFQRGLGVAPGTRYFEQEFQLFRYLPAGVADLVRDSLSNGATISNNSWGTSNIPKGYNADALLIDAATRDADPTRPGNQELCYVQSIHNGRGGISSQGAPEEAKNVIVVGSTRAADSEGNPRLDVNSLSDNSAHGPALDGRRIPHVVAPGCQVDSTVPDFGGGYGFQLMCGTSQAAAQVSGAAALFTEYYRRLPEAPGDPSPALIKAAVLAVARDLQGNVDADGTLLGHRPDSKQGWGRLDLRALVQPPPASVIYYDQERVFEETGEEWLREVVPVDPGRPIRIMLVWTDAPGHGLGGTTPAWNNDLDLVVDAGGSTYRGNVFGGDGWSATGGAADAQNNAEAVHLAAPSGRIQIRVQASNINSDGVPNTGDALDQDFALVCYNCAYARGFDLVPEPVTRNVCALQPAQYDIAVDAHGGFVEPIRLSVTGVPAGGTAGFDVNPVSPGGRSLLTVNLGGLADGAYELTLSGITARVDRSHPLYLNLRTAVPAAAALTQPPAGAAGVAPQPLLEWSPVPWAASYVVEVSTDPTFQNIFYSARTETPLHRVGVLLPQSTLHYWRVRARNACGFGAFAPASSFTTRDVPPVLLVDDDWDRYGDYQAVYRAALEALPGAPYNYPVSYDVWDVYAVEQREEPAAADLAAYEKVIWWSGKEDFYAGPTTLSEFELANWFDRRGGCLLVTSADYVFARDGVTAFMTGRLGVGSVAEDLAQKNETGQGSVFGGLGTMNLTALNPDFSDAVSPGATAELAFTSDRGHAGIDKNGGHYRTSFLGFGVERLSRAADREAVLLRFLRWCDGLAAADGDGDGVANGVDCVPGDAAAWTAPAPVTDLALHRAANGFTWSQPVSGGGAVYDLLRSAAPGDFWNATCAATGVAETSVPAAWDADPRPGEAAFYLVRARSDCGMAAMGSASDGTPRQGTACR